MKEFLPIARSDMDRRGWESCDFILVSGDAYVDHPSFGHAIISRVLEREGFRVGIIPQPDWRTPESFRILGKPRLGFLVTSGNMDSMVNHYTAARKPRSEDAYSPGGAPHRRPDRAAIVYANRAREAFKGVPVILGGIEASLRRLAHYDYWSDSLRRSIILDSKADLLVYGMGERAITEIARRLASGMRAADIRDVPGIVYVSDTPPGGDAVLLPSHEDLKNDRNASAKSFRIQMENADPRSGKILSESYGSRRVIQNPPAEPLSPEELDSVYELPYMRMWHPSYVSAGGVPAFDEVRFSLVSSRGCFGGCGFCALGFHQGRIVTARSGDSLVREAILLTEDPAFKGYLHDVGGPTANFRIPACKKQERAGACGNRQCLFPEPCAKLEVSHADYLSVLRRLREVPGIKKVFIRSGIRFDYLLLDPDETFFRELCEFHISGQLKIAPEHVSSAVLAAMGKADSSVYRRFMERFAEMNRLAGKKQYLVPYFISGHPGSRLKDAIELAEFMRDHRIRPEQVQDFYPTPGTVSTCMYYTEIDPRTMMEISVPKAAGEKAMQRALLQYTRRENHELVRKALLLAGRGDLIGTGGRCLVPPVGRPGTAGRPGRAGGPGQSGRRPERHGRKDRPRS